MWRVERQAFYPGLPGCSRQPQASERHVLYYQSLENRFLRSYLLRGYNEECWKQIIWYHKLSTMAMNKQSSSYFRRLECYESSGWVNEWVSEWVSGRSRGRKWRVAGASCMQLKKNSATSEQFAMGRIFPLRISCLSRQSPARQPGIQLARHLGSQPSIHPTIDSNVPLLFHLASILLMAHSKVSRKMSVKVWEIVNFFQPVKLILFKQNNTKP